MPPPRLALSKPADRLGDLHFCGCALGSISMTGRNVAARQRSTSMRRFGRYAAVYVDEGRGTYIDDAGTRCELLPGDLILVFPDLAHVYGPKPVWSEHYIVFDGPLFRAWEMAGILDRANPIVRLGTAVNWVERLNWITASGVPTNPAAALLELCRLQQVLAEMLGQNPRWQRAAADPWIEQARAALEQPHPLSRSMSALADEFCVSGAAFRRKFRSAVGLSPKKYRLLSLIRHAQVLMLEEELSDKQIALRLGFADPAHLSRRFRQVVGVSPRQYRRLCQPATRSA